MLDLVVNRRLCRGTRKGLTFTVFAEKIRAMGERGRPRDLYDIINLFRHSELEADATVIRTILEEKCLVKDIPVPTLDSVRTEANREALESEWVNMLAHQLPVLPPLEAFWNEIGDLFAWLEKTIKAAALPRIPIASSEIAPDETSIAVPQPIGRERSFGRPDHGTCRPLIYVAGLFWARLHA